MKKLKRTVKYPLPEKVVKDTKKKIKKHTTDPDADKVIASSNKSVFAKQLKTIRKANVAHNYDEQARLVVYKAMLDMVLNLIPIAEVNYRQYKQDRSAYALNTYLNQVRELQNDMRSMQDFSQQMEMILVIFRKIMSLVAQNLIDEMYAFKVDLREYIKNPKALKSAQAKLDKMTKGHAGFMHECLKNVEEQLVNLLLAPEEKTFKKKKQIIVKGGP